MSNRGLLHVPAVPLCQHNGVHINDIMGRNIIDDEGRCHIPESFKMKYPTAEACDGSKICMCFLQNNNNESFWYLLYRVTHDTIGPSNVKRFSGYREAARLLGYSQRTPLPLCVRWLIEFNYGNLYVYVKYIIK